MIIRLIRFLKRAYDLRTDPVRYFRSLGVQIGDHCRLIDAPSLSFGGEPYLVRLGNHVTISGGVNFITHDGGVWVFSQEYPDIDVFGAIAIRDNVFVGSRAIIMPGVTIGENSVIGAGAVVTKDIPPNHVAVGCPARPIETIEEYWGKIESSLVAVHSLSLKDRQAFLEKHYLGKG